MELETFLEIVDLKGDLPVIPEVLTKVLSIIRDEKGSAGQLAEVILKDQSLTAKILRLANSSFYAGASKAPTNVSQAIVVLGFDSIRELAVGLSMFALLRDKKLEDYLGQFWVHSVACAVCAKALSVALGHEDTEEALVAGLLHDVGKIILLRFLPEEFTEIQILVDQGMTTEEAEEQVLQLRHQDVGEAVALRWNLPQRIVRCIRHHHHFAEYRKDDYSQQLGNVVTLANIFAMHYYPSSAIPLRVPTENFLDLARQHLDLDEDVVRNILKMMRRRVEEYLDIFGVTATEEAGRELDQIDTAQDAAARAQAKIYEMQHELKLKSLALRRVVDIGRTIISGVPIHELIERILEAIQSSTGADAVALALLNRNRGRIDGVAGVGYGIRPIVKRLHLPHSRKDNLLSRVIYDIKPINVLDVESPIYSKILSEWERSVWGAPAFTVCPIVSQGAGVGAIIADRRAARRALSDSEVELIGVFADLVSAAIDRYRKDMAPGASPSEPSPTPAPA